MKQNINTLRIPAKVDDFFGYWFAFLQPYHQLTKKEMEVAIAFVKHRYELGKVIKDPAILDKVVMGEDIKKKIREECNIKLGHFQVIMGKLRKRHVIENDKINPKFIPNLTDENSVFQLLFVFELKS